MRTKYFIALALMVTFLGVIPTCAQKPLEKPQKRTQTTTTSSSSMGKSSSTSTTRNTTQASSSTQTPKTKSAKNQINGHEYVDLGLSVKWATCNVGATYPSDYGDFYAWGEILTKSVYSKTNCLTWEKDMLNIEGDPTYDVARAVWGGSWRLPSISEMEELLDKCYVKLSEQDGRDGCKIVGPNGNSIFMPFAGSYDETEHLRFSQYGYYWSSTPNNEDTRSAYRLLITSESIISNNCDWSLREFGFSVRPVTE